MDTITPAEYYAVFTSIIQYGRTSIFIKILLLIPPLLALLYLILLGPEDALFLLGVIVYTIGSLLLSRLVNEPRYTQLLAQDREDHRAIAELRTEINRANMYRAIVSSLGVFCMMISFLI